MPELRFGPAALAEVDEADEWYRARSDRAADDFIAELESAAARIAENPAQFPIVFDAIRRARMRRFPYALFFRIADDAAVVIACLHGSRDPRRWRRRSP